MRACASLILLVACGFDGPPPAVTDAPRPVDAPIDVPVDQPPPSLRVRDGLIGEWAFDEPAGSLVAADRAGTAMPVNLKVVTSPSAMIVAPTFGDGRATATAHSRLVAMPERNHLAVDPATGGGVTLEAWLQAAEATQGDATRPRYVVGLGRNQMMRNIALLQQGDRWLALARTQTAADGRPGLPSMSAVSTALVHVVITADATHRRLYIDGVVEAEDQGPANPMSWDPMALFTVFAEPTGGNFWRGSVALVALYDRALSQAEIDQNRLAGAEAE